MSSDSIKQEKALQKKERDSNIELLRIFLMLMIIAFHYVGNSGIQHLYNFDNITINQIFLELYGWGGKAGINCFLLITGYFMCRQQFTWKKFLKLYLEIKFYAIFIFSIFCISGYQTPKLLDFYRTIFNVAMGIGHEFAASFIILFLLIPFINKLIKSLNKREHGLLIIILLTSYSVIGTFVLNNFFEYVGWYITVYNIGAYLRIYPYEWAQNKRFTAVLAIISLLLSWSSILLISYIPQLHRFGVDVYYFVFDSNRILAISSAVAFFLFFRSINLGSNKIINSISSCTFGVLLIHGHSDIMRQWLWHDTLHVTNQFTNDYLWLHALCSVAAVYVACVFLDLCRQIMIERPFFIWISRRFPQLI